MKNCAEKMIAAEKKMMDDYMKAFVTMETMEYMDTNMLACLKSAKEFMDAANEYMLKQAELMETLVEKLNALEVKN